LLGPVGETVVEPGWSDSVIAASAAASVGDGAVGLVTTAAAALPDCCCWCCCRGGGETWLAPCGETRPATAVTVATGTDGDEMQPLVGDLVAAGMRSEPV